MWELSTACSSLWLDPASYVVPFLVALATDRNDSQGYVYQWEISQDIEKQKKSGNCIISYFLSKLNKVVTENG